MYHPIVIHKNLLKASEVIGKRHALSAQWRLKYPTPSERDGMIRHLADLAPDGKPLRELTREEKLWVLSETTLCKLDFHYYSSNYVYIEDWEGRVSRFKPNIAQQLGLEYMAEADLAAIAQLYQDLKARQLGDTTVIQILMSHRVFFYRNVKCVTGSAEPDKSRRMVAKLEFIWDHLPWWMRPRRTSYRAGEHLAYADLNNTIDVVWGNQKKGVAKGMTASVAHLSELGEWDNPDELVDASFIRTIHENPFSLIFLEGTAERMGDWWNKTWDFNVKMDARSLARFKPRFWPWFVGSDIYPTPAWLRRRPIPRGWQPPEYIERHAEAAEAYTRSDKKLRKHLGAGWKMPLAQKWFYHLEYEEWKAKKQLHGFFKMMPANPQQAWQNANPSIFDVEVLGEVQTGAVASTPINVYQLSGPSVAQTYQEYRPDPAQRPLILDCKSASGKVHETFTLQPLRLEAWPDLEPNGKIYIWEPPQTGEIYGIGVDPSEGVDQDRSVVSVIKKSTPWHPDEQVAEFASPRVFADDLWLWVFALAHLYTVPRADSAGWSFPRVVIEINHSAGDKVQTHMLNRGWMEFHRRYDPSKIGQVGSGAMSRPRALAEEIGWRTDIRTRPKLISAIRKAVRDGLFKVRSPELARELATLEYNLDKKRIEASQGNHDDTVFASGIVLASWYDPEVYGTTPQPWTEARDRERKLMEDPRLPGGPVLLPARSFSLPSTNKLTDSRSLIYCDK